jgi:coniferyl-aldehyde dehydrogenase
MAERAVASETWTPESMRAVLARQRAAFLAELPVSAETRVDRIDRAIDLLVRSDHRIAEALDADFGCRPRDFSRFTEAAASVAALKHARKRLRRWMRPEPRSLDFPLGLLGGRAWVEYLPKGVVGVISPWNFPVYLTFGPMSGALAAGNRVMVKPSEHTPETSALMAELVADAFDDTEVVVCTGGPDVGRAFSELALDHLLFTGGTAIGRLVMRSAADNLVPVTLELGGKSPVIVGRSADLGRAAQSVALGKLTNAGQVCIAPDYAFVPADRVADFAAKVEEHLTAMYPTLGSNPQYTSVINEHHFRRLRETIDEARAWGAEIREINPSGEDLSDGSLRKLPPTLVLEPGDELRLMREEIFGPVLPIKGYRDIEDVVDYINHRPRPLSLYYFGHDADERRRLLSGTVPGGVTLNEVLAHALIESLPFGGIGASGMGAYRGIDGFRTFSHPRGMFKAPRPNMWKLMGLLPPYGKKLTRTVERELRR